RHDEMLLAPAIEGHERALLGKPRHGAERAVHPPALRIVLHGHDARAGGELEKFWRRKIGDADGEIALDLGLQGGACAAERYSAVAIVPLGGGPRRREQQRLDAVAMRPDAARIELFERVSDAVARTDAAENIDKILLVLPPYMIERYCVDWHPR